ncbi:hypothetical protein B0T26DRAFT_331658 [Lasiosphaeria miniovina]|uniref:Carbohydrate-binding module family 50 protein n=1 Tax=Lasiosphaeria miniovina TaxID=1954250 RepID=A0AA40AM93_9PEZI|nr:uncharacterized protein B0T26DRAFT_331658 [Lasiosphaeria miniovina]KAK0718450.1 hypothetical protein B0T26DRAFT_331658 [Lasiosphaeria miniovina]
MGRWSHLDTDEERLPPGMTRVGYDADTQIYTYRDTDGSIWEGVPGSQYGTLHRSKVAEAPPLPSVHIPDDVEGEEKPYVLHDPDDDSNDEDLVSTTLSQPQRARLRESHLDQTASKPLPRIPSNTGSYGTASDGRYKRLEERRQQPRTPQRSGTVSRLYRYFVRDSQDTRAGSMSKQQLARASTVRETPVHPRPGTNRPRRATTFDEILDRH